MSEIYVKNLYTRINKPEEWKLRKNIVFGMRSFNFVFLVSFVCLFIDFEKPIINVLAVIGSISLILNIAFEIYCRINELATKEDHW